jgi:methionyl-tRNA synthetase
MTRKIYVTTAIAYVNAEPHIGFALELLQADVIARFHRLCGRDVCFQTGTDENAIKTVLAAAERGLAPQELADRNAQRYRDPPPREGWPRRNWPTETRNATATC